MLKSILKALDGSIGTENLRRIKSDDGESLIRPCNIRVLGQFGLIEAKISQVATRDVDAQIDGDYWIKKKFEQLLSERGFFWDQHSHEIRMPKETQYDSFYAGENVTALIAQPEYILISKALYAPEKNRGVFEEYIASGSSKKFLDLAKKYKIDLKKLIGKPK
jgi:hypothetical protein